MIFGWERIRIMNWISQTSQLTSVLHVLLLTLDRYNISKQHDLSLLFLRFFVILYPMKYFNVIAITRRKHLKLFILCLSFWIFSGFVIGIQEFHIYFNNNETFYKTIWDITYNVFVIFILLVILILYIPIFSEFRQLNSKRNFPRINIKNTKTIFCLVLFALFCFVPESLLFILYDLRWITIVELENYTAISCLVILVNCVFNPLLYTLKTSTFRKVFSDLMEKLLHFLRFKNKNDNIFYIRNK